MADYAKMEPDNPIVLRLVEALTRAWTTETSRELMAEVAALQRDLEPLYVRRVASALSEPEHARSHAALRSLAESLEARLPTPVEPPSTPDHADVETTDPEPRIGTRRRPRPSLSFAPELLL